MKLDIVQREAVGVYHDVFLAFVDEYADTFCTGWQVFRHFVQVTGGFGIEDEAYHVYAQLFYAADILRFGHTAYFDDKWSHGMYGLLFEGYNVLFGGLFNAFYEFFQRFARLSGFHKGFSDKETVETGIV